MITHIDITGVGSYAPDQKTKRYVRKKIGQLDRFVSRHARKSIRADVKLAQVNRDNGNKYEAEVILVVPDKRLTARDSTMNVVAAVDIVEAKLAAQLRKYKTQHVKHIGQRKIMDRFKHSFAREQQV